MQDSNIPAKIPQPFGTNAAGPNIRPIPDTTVDPTAASFSLGFPPATLTPISAGGSPPFGKDFNGILNILSAWAQWLSAGGPVPYDPVFSPSIGGYPAGAVVEAVQLGFAWLCLTDNNTSNPETGGAGWSKFSYVPNYGYQTYKAHGTYTFVVPAGVYNIFAQVCGAGAGGAGSNSTSQGGAGGAGGYDEGWLSVTPGQSVTVTVGQGSAGVGVNTTAAQGGTSSVLTISSTGGLGGNHNTPTGSNAGGVPGLGSGGSLNIYGGHGGDGAEIAGTVLVSGAMGGASFFGGGGRQGEHGGVTALAPGSGGGGAYGGSGNGGDGADGAVTIRW